MSKVGEKRRDWMLVCFEVEVPSPFYMSHGGGVEMTTNYWRWKVTTFYILALTAAHLIAEALERPNNSQRKSPLYSNSCNTTFRLEARPPLEAERSQKKERIGKTLLPQLKLHYCPRKVTENGKDRQNFTASTRVAFVSANADRHELKPGRLIKFLILPT